MTRHVIFYFVLIILTSCSDDYRLGNAKKFNDLVAQRQDIETPEELISLYYDPNGNNDDPEFKITSTKVSENNFEITLIQEGIGDDSVYGERIIMRAQLKGSTWTVTEIKMSWKCQNERGHQNWSAAPCD